MSPRRPESFAEAKFAVATARKRKMVALVMVRFMLLVFLGYYDWVLFAVSFFES